MPDFNENMEWVAADTETTGLNPWQHEIIEIGAVRFNYTEITERFQVLIKPKKKQDPRARAVHNISNQELDEKGQEADSAIRAFLEFIGDAPLVFHNAPFDVAFFKLACRSLGIEMPDNYYYDNLFLSRKYFQERKSHSLSALRAIYNIETGQAHRALADAEATALVFLQTLKLKNVDITSKNKLRNFMRYHRKLSEFELKIPENYEEIERYFDRKIKSGELVKIQYTDKQGRVNQHFVQALEIMVFNQNLFVKAVVHPERSQQLIPLKNAVVYDAERGPVAF